MEKLRNDKKKKTSYTLFQNSLFMLAKIWKYDRPTAFLMALQIPLAVLIAAIGVYMPKVILDELIKNAGAPQLLAVIGVFTLVLIIANMLASYFKNLVYWRLMYIRMYITDEVFYKVMDTDYENIENPSGQTMLQKAVNAGFSGNGSALYRLPSYCVTLLTDIVCLILFGGILTSLNPLLILLLAVSAAIRYFSLKLPVRYIRENQNKWSRLDKKLQYLESRSADFSNGKDVRLYRMSNWFSDLFGQIIKERVDWTRKVENRYFTEHVFNHFIYFLRDGIVYAYVIYMAMRNALSIPDALLYLNAVNAFSGRLNSLMNDYEYLSRANVDICNLREYISMPERSNRGSGAALPQSAGIRFENVSFTYPGSGESVLRGFDLEIKKGEKLAIVGRNGAGKTTAVKLMCGFYKPTEGRVLINGVDIRDFNYEEYFSLISAVFQDIKLMPVSIAENVSSSSKDNTDMDRVWRCLRMAGLEEKAAFLPMGADTPLVKGIEEVSVELSGGEQQKLMLARALYKDAPLIILDEPTAALDPIAEHEIYMRYNELTRGKTSVYISHRLASTRFCDKIAFIDNGMVAEYGSHDELMRKRGKYAEMFDVQSYYYQKELKNKRLREEGMI